MKFSKTGLQAGLVALSMALGAWTTGASAETVDFSIGNDSFRAAVGGPLGASNGKYDIGGLYRRRNGHDAFVAHVGGLLTGDAGMVHYHMNAGLGARAVYVDLDGASGGAFALGGQAEIRFPGYERIGLSAYGYYAPSVVSFRDFDRFDEVGAALSYQVLRNASIYVGYRNVEVSLDNGPDLTVDNSFLAGMRLNF